MPPFARTIVRGLAPHALVLLYDDWTRIQLRRIRLIRSAPLDALRDARWLEHELLPRLGVSEQFPEAVPSELQPAVGAGLQPLQWPNQLAPYLVALSRYRIRSYLEIGVFRGGLFVLMCEYLARFNRLEGAIGVDVYPVRGADRYRLLRPRARVVQISSGAPEFRRCVERWRPDLVMIDGDHTYPAVKRDFEAVDGVAPLIAFHDIVDPFTVGSPRFWGELRAERAADYHFAEFTAQYPEVNERHGVEAQFGIGLAVRRDFGPPPV